MQYRRIGKGASEYYDLKVDQNTGSKITLSGKADKLDVSGDTGSKFKGNDLKHSNCNAKSVQVQEFILLFKKN